MHQHRLNAVLQRHRTRVAGPARTPQLQHHNTIREAPELDITTIFLDRRSDAGFQKLLDHTDNLLVFLTVCQCFLVATLLGILLSSSLFYRVHNLLARCHGLSDQTEHFRFDVRPVGIARLGHCDKVDPVEDG